ncbi:MAG: phosphohydrolase, partial [Bacteroidales bacterium]|nr:phosphohydrolase [Bacteroidales bacterium]
TTGRPEMTLLEKIIYLADYIEPTRDFDGVEPLRELTYSDLDRAMLLGLQMSLDELREKGIAPHPNTADALSWYQKQGEQT